MNYQPKYCECGDPMQFNTEKQMYRCLNGCHALTPALAPSPTENVDKDISDLFCKLLDAVIRKQAQLNTVKNQENI